MASAFDFLDKPYPALAGPAVLLVLGAVAQYIIMRRLEKRYPAVPKPIQTLQRAETLEKLEKLITAWGP
jgi:hypothetical protein